MFKYYLPTLKWLEFFDKLDFTQLDQLVSVKDFFLSTEIKCLNPPCTLMEFFGEAQKISFKENYERISRETTALQNLTGITFKKSYEIQHMMPFIKDLCLKHNCKYIIDVGSGLVRLKRLFD